MNKNVYLNFLFLNKFQLPSNLFIETFLRQNGDWGLGIGDWGLGIGPNPQSPIPNPQSPGFYASMYFKHLYNLKIKRLLNKVCLHYSNHEKSYHSRKGSSTDLTIGDNL